MISSQGDKRFEIECEVTATGKAVFIVHAQSAEKAIEQLQENLNYAEILDFDDSEFMNGAHVEIDEIGPVRSDVEPLDVPGGDR